MERSYEKKQIKLSPELLQSYHFCQEVARQSNFYSGILFTEKTKRDAIFSIYAWLRAIDDITDNPALTSNEKANMISAFRQKTSDILNNNDKMLLDANSFWPAFLETMRHYQIPYSYLENMLVGQKQDLTKIDYRTFDELYDYCRDVASMVGLICIRIWGHEGGDKALQMAEWCGIAFQLTNILRDFQEDAHMRHVYLPAEFVGLKKLTPDMLHQVSEQQIMIGIQRLIAKASEYYNNSLELYQLIDDDGKLSFLVMVYAYRAIYEKIRKHPELVLKPQRVKLGKMEKIKLITMAVINHSILHRG